MWEPMRTANAEPPRFPHPPVADLDPPGRPTGRPLRCLPPADRQSPAMPKIYFKLLHSPPPIQPLFSLGCPLSILLQSFHIPGRHIPLAARTAECHSGSASMTHSCRIPFSAIPRSLGSGAKDAPLPPRKRTPRSKAEYLSEELFLLSVFSIPSEFGKDTIETRAGMGYYVGCVNQNLLK